MGQTAQSIGAVLLIAALGAVTAVSASSLTPEQLPASVVAVVSHVPVSMGKITKAELQRALAEKAAAAGRSTTPGPGAAGYYRLRDEALEELLSVIWIEGQAAMMEIDATAGEVTRELARIKADNFKSEAEYRRFLRDSRFTERDVRQRVRLQLLATRIEERVARQATGNISGAFKRFVKAYRERWTARTVCAPRFVIGKCSNAPPSGRPAA